MKTLTLKVPESLDRKLALKAKELRRTKSALMRQMLEYLLVGSFSAGSSPPRPQDPALDELFLNSRKRRFVSALDLAGDLVGCIDGPPDLSTNPKYMEGFGQ
ncbi:MAG: ribbon-helix-helix protein, CopG family [Phycisphaerae bacterium]